MHDAVTVRRGESATKLVGNRHCRVQIHWTFESLTEAEKLHDDKDLTLGGGVETHDVDDIVMLVRLAAIASLKRSKATPASSMARVSTLIAKCRSRWICLARYTAPIPPMPIS